MEKGNKLNRSIDVNQFKDREGISVGKLNFGLWIISHRRFFITALIVFLLAISAIFYGYSIYGYVDYFFFGGKKERLAIEQLAEDQSVADIQKLRNVADPLQLGGMQTFSHNGRYDFLVKIVNPNKDFLSSFEYCATVAGQEVACQTGFILPLENKYFSILNKEISSFPTNATLAIRNQGWQRIDAHQYPNWLDFASSHLNFVISSTTFKTAKQTGISDKLEFDSVEFKIANKTAYNYFEVPLNIVAFSGNSPAGANYYSLSSFKSGETRDVKIIWSNSLPSISRVEIYPSLNILKSDIYIRY